MGKRDTVGAVANPGVGRLIRGQSMRMLGERFGIYGFPLTLSSEHEIRQIEEPK